MKIVAIKRAGGTQTVRFTSAQAHVRLTFNIFADGLWNVINPLHEFPQRQCQRIMIAIEVKRKPACRSIYQAISRRKPSRITSRSSSLWMTGSRGS